ncbi:hypothetical protein D3C81_1442130 [compost metagenome]
MLSNAVHTADCRDNEQVIADADFAVSTPVALKGQLPLRIGYRMKFGLVVIFLFSGQVSLDVMRVDPVARCNRSDRVADGIAVFGDYFIRCEGG